MKTDKRLLQARSLALEEKDMEIQPRPFIRSYRSNETTESHQQPSIEKKSIKEDASLIDIPAIDHQPMPPISSPKEEKPKFMHICNQDEFFMEPKEIK